VVEEKEERETENFGAAIFCAKIFGAARKR
jgi:hypothetical protein